MKIGNRLTHLREARHMTPYMLAKQTGIPQSHLTKIEKDNVTPRLDTVCLLADALGCTLSEFFNEDTSTFYLTEDEQALITVYRQLQPVQQPLIKMFADALDNANKQ